MNLETDEPIDLWDVIDTAFLLSPSISCPYLHEELALLSKILQDIF